MDEAIGTVLTKLRTEKLEENTIIVFLRDNGGPTMDNDQRLVYHEAQRLRTTRAASVCPR